MTIDADIASELTAPAADVLLDDAQRHYLITPPGATEAKPYLRTTSYIDVINDSSHLDRWRRRLLLEHFAEWDGLVLEKIDEALSHPTLSKSKALDELARQLHTDAGGDEKRDYGTEIHEALRCHLVGGPFRPTQDRWLPEIGADLAAIKALLEQHALFIDPTYVEVPLALHELEVAGRTDGFTIPSSNAPRRVIDLKSGSVSPVSWAMQLAVYAHADHIVSNEGRTLTDMPWVDREVGYIIQAPKGTGKATLWEVDLVKGWADVQLARQIHAIRGAKQAERITRVVVGSDGAVKNGTDVSLVVAASRHDFICARIDDIKAHGTEAAQMLGRVWPTEAPTRVKLNGRQWSDEECDAIEAALVEVGKAHAVPFPTVLSEAPPKREAKPAPAPLPDEGDDVPAEDVEALQASVAKLEPLGRAWLMAVAASAKTAGRPIAMKETPTLRRWSIIRALWLCASADPNDDVLRSMLGVVMGEEVQPTVSLGMAVGSLTIDEAERLGRLAMALGTGVAVAYDDAGAVRLVGDVDKAMAA